MKLSRTVSYALQATLQLAQSDSSGPIPCSRLAAQGKMPERFLLQILRNLVAHGILGSTRGVEGGYTLERSAEEISLLEVIEAIEGPLISALPAGEGLPQDSRSRPRAGARRGEHRCAARIEGDQACPLVAHARKTNERIWPRTEQVAQRGFRRCGGGIRD